MVIFHSYVILPEGRYEVQGQVKVWILVQITLKFGWCHAKDDWSRGVPWTKYREFKWGQSTNVDMLRKKVFIWLLQFFGKALRMFDVWGCLFFNRNPMDSVYYIKTICQNSSLPSITHGKSPRYFRTIFPRKKRPFWDEISHHHWGPPASGLQKTLGSMDFMEDSMDFHGKCYNVGPPR